MSISHEIIHVNFSTVIWVCLKSFSRLEWLYGSVGWSLRMTSQKFCLDGSTNISLQVRHHFENQ